MKLQAVEKIEPELSERGGGSFIMAFQERLGPKIPKDKQLVGGTDPKTLTKSVLHHPSRKKIPKEA